MIIAPAILAAALTLDFQGLSVITPFRSPAENVSRVWVFLPSTSGMPHRATLVLEKAAVLGEDWRPDLPGANNTGSWYLEGYVLSVYRDGVKDSPDQIRMWAPGKEQSPWESLHWVLDLGRVAPNGRIAADPFAGNRAVAAIKLADGDLDGAAPGLSRQRQMFIVQPTEPKYEQAFTDTVRYTVDLKDAATELRLDPVPGGKKPAKRIRLVPKVPVHASVMHLPERGSTASSHASAAASLFADEESRGRIGRMNVGRTVDIPGSPICDPFIIHIGPRPGPCTKCFIDLAPAGRTSTSDR